eukprot:361515-Chlamydomonas_euryale.AAC.2
MLLSPIRTYHPFRCAAPHLATTAPAFARLLRAEGRRSALTGTDEAALRRRANCATRGASCVSGRPPTPWS